MKKVFNEHRKLHYSDLTREQKDMAITQLLYMYQTWAIDGDIDDKNEYELLTHNGDYLLDKMESCSYSLTADGAVEVWI